MSNTEPLACIDRYIDEVVANGFVVTDFDNSSDYDYTEPTNSGNGLFELMFHTSPFSYDEKYEQLFDQYLSHTQALAELSVSRASRVLEAGQLDYDPYMLAERVGEFVCRNQAMHGLVEIARWQDIIYGERPHDYEAGLGRARMVGQDFTTRYSLASLLAKIPGTSFEQTPTTLMDWHIYDSLSSFLTSCERLIGRSNN